MAITALDKGTALIVIDLQNGIVALPVTPPVGEVTARAGALAAAFREHDLPVVLVTVMGVAPGRAEQARRLGELPADWADLIPKLNRQPSDLLVTKRTWGAFTHTDLEAQLRARAVTQVVLAGIATSIGVESTARQAYELGFNVTLAVDAMADLNADAHHNTITRIFPRLGETGTTQAVIERLAHRDV
jgi:nicotinamidase-related amidase